MLAGKRQRWDIFCRVIDNLGDIGTCWRLARQLAHEYEFEVRLWVDQWEPFASLCPSISVNADSQRVDSVHVHRWTNEFNGFGDDVGDVVIEAFACDVPSSYVTGMARKSVSPVWINLEYLSAEDWIDDCHCVTSPHPTLPLTKYFFFPGFTHKSGGLLKERDLDRDRDAFGPVTKSEFLRSIGVELVEENELLMSLFCYENPALPDFLHELSVAQQPVRLVATAGFASTQVETWLQRKLPHGTFVQRGALILQAIPYISQVAYDRLLWSCDLNFVRGEDSFVRAQWARKPFVWQIYPQSEMTHLLKLDAFLSRYLEDSEHAALVREFWRAWNGVGSLTGLCSEIIESRQSLEEHAKQWSEQLDRMRNLANNLVLFVQNRS